jgi:predicted MFS family arabinose efflux permease
MTPSQPAEPQASGGISVLTVIALCTFTASLSTRSLDPVLPNIASELSITVATAAGLSAGTALTFALVQPVLGATADIIGKARLMMICLVILGLANIIGSFATSYPLLLVTRILCGIGAGGTFPVAMSLTGDLVPLKDRQLALSRNLMGSMSGNLLGASFSGVIGDLIGWRPVLVILGVLVLCGAAMVFTGFRRSVGVPGGPVELAALRKGYAEIFSNPNAAICYSAVFVEGVCILGLFPYLAAFLVQLGEPRLSIAGVVIAGFAIGGLFYTLSVSRLLSRLGVHAMMMTGAAIIASQLAIIGLGPPWQVQLVNMVLMGWGFYMLHGSIQVFATELSVNARATAFSLHSFFFFLGQSAGPLIYGFLLSHIGKSPTLLVTACAVVILGVVIARLLNQPRPRQGATP